MSAVIDEPITLAEVRAAADRVRGSVLRTPLVRLPVDGEVYAKAENLQRTNSFKIRGASNFLHRLDDDARRRGVVAFSSGNHAQAVACAAAQFDVAATIVIPDNAPDLKVARTEAWGATVVRCGYGEQQAIAESLAVRSGATLVPPFDHPWIIEGQGTVGLEIAQDLPGVANVVVCVGGGGLIAGCATALHALVPDARIIAVEPELAADGAASFDAGALTAWPAASTTRTVADGVRTTSLGVRNFEVIQRLVDRFVTVGEAEILHAARWYLDTAKLLVEPTGALTFAAHRTLAAAGTLRPGPTVLVVSGGNIDVAHLLGLRR